MRATAQLYTIVLIDNNRREFHQVLNYKEDVDLRKKLAKRLRQLQFSQTTFSTCGKNAQQ